MSGGKNMDEPLPSLDELLRGPIALGVLRALMRDQERQMRVNGASVARWMLPVYSALDQAASADPTKATFSAVIGRRLASVEPTIWVGVVEAAERCGRSERHVRRLASLGSVRAKRVGRGNWLIDIDSLENVLRRAA